MKFTLAWLADHLDMHDVATAALGEAMTMLGLEVEAVHDPAAALSAFSAARVVSAAPHPNADKLQVCQVETIDGPKEIVCGALNARAGLVTAYAPIGAYVPGLGVTLIKKPVRGVDSNGMLCSGGELEVEEDPFGLRVARFSAWAPRATAVGKTEEQARADGGILELPDDTPVGAPVAPLFGLDDPVIDFEATPNRPDWLGVVGIARDLAAAGLGRFREPYVPPVEGAFACPIAVRIEDEAACPVFAGRLIRGVRNGPSPEWLQRRLRAIGLRPKNILVDVTNYIAYDRARPLHVYDAQKLSGVVHARLGRAGEMFYGLDGKEHQVIPEMCVIADDARVLGLGGVIGGEYSGSTESTVDVFVESALFDPLRTARTGRATGIVSDAQYRFARGVDPAFVVPGLELATRMILDLCGGEASEIVVAGQIPDDPAPIEFDPALVHRLTGLELPHEGIVDILERLGFVAGEHHGQHWTIEVPSWRGDCRQPADLVEEVARVIGYDQLPATPLPRPTGRRAPAMSPNRRRTGAVRRTLAGRGLQETVLFSFCTKAEAALFGADPEALALANPISVELEAMRPSALPHLLRAVQKNADRGAGALAFFEVGPCYRAATEDGQETVAAGVRRGLSVRHWSGAAAPDVFTVKADVFAALEAAGFDPGKARVVEGSGEVQAQAWHPGRSGRLMLGPKTVLAVFGELHPRVLQALDADGPILGFEVYLDRLPALKEKAGRSKGALALSDLMPLSRDFAFVVDAATPADTLVRAAAGADPLVAAVGVFDVFAGPAIGEGKVSIGLDVTLQPTEKTLDEAAIEAVSNRIVATVTKASGAVLRAG